MLKTLDILIGLAVVMLLASLIVTVMTQFATSIWNSRGKHLLKGITDLLQQVAPGMERNIAGSIAGAVLTHPLIRASGGRYGDVIQRGELTAILLELAAGKGPQTLEAAAREHLTKALRDGGIADPEAALQKVTDLLLELQIAHPDAVSAVQHNLALLQGAKSVFVARVNAWFDQTIDRVADRFTFTTRGVTFVMGMILAFTLQLDTPLLVNRLASDPQLRSELVQKAVALDPQHNDLTNLSNQAKLDSLSTANLLSVPASFSDWQNNWNGAGPHPNITGVLLSAILLSFGAPFWYNALKNLLQLRSALTQKDDEQRAARQAAPGTRDNSANG